VPKREVRERERIKRYPAKKKKKERKEKRERPTIG
jgi:hypothetical protein